MFQSNSILGIIFPISRFIYASIFFSACQIKISLENPETSSRFSNSDTAVCPLTGVDGESSGHAGRDDGHRILQIIVLVVHSLHVIDHLAGRCICRDRVLHWTGQHGTHTQTKFNNSNRLAL